MKKQFIYFLVLISLCVVNSCKKTEQRPDYSENIRIKMTETADNVKRVLHLICQTDTIFPCTNFPIDATYTLTTDKITINFIKTIISSTCLTSPGPATVVFDLAALSNKTYALELNFGTTTITGQLAVTTDSYVATLPTQTKAQFVTPDLKRIPDNTIYGRVGYGTVSLSPLAQTFIDTLQLYGAKATSYLPGYYTDFQLDSNGQIMPTLDGYYFRQNFIFNYSNGSGQLKDLVKRFGARYASLLSVTLKTSKGESFYSWVP